MNISISELQKNQFGFVHDFHTERTAGIIEALQGKLGDEVIDTLKKADIDRYSLYKWHLERTANLLELLQDKFGPKVMEIVLEYERSSARERGINDGKELNKNSLEDIISHFTSGDNNRIVEKNENEVFIKTSVCFAGKGAYELGKSNDLYNLHCGLDKYFVEGFNNELGCEVVKSIMNGDDYCLHRIYKKNK